MMKSVSTLGLMNARSANLRRLEGQLAATQSETSTGRHADPAAKLGAQSGTLIDLRNSFSSNETFLTSIETFERRATMMSDALVLADEALNGLQVQAVLNSPEAGQSISALGSSALGAIGSLVSTFNTTIDGRYLFSGVETDAAALIGAEEPSPVTLITPEDVMAGILDGTAYAPAQPPAFTAPFTAGQAATAIARFDDVFNGTNAGAGAPTEDYSFERGIFGGTPGTDLFSVRADDGPAQSYGVTAEDQAVRDALQGAYMLASVDLIELAGTDAYAPYVDAALSKINTGLDGIRQHAAALGSVQQQIIGRKTALEAQQVVLNEQINILGQADPIEAQVRFGEIEKQLDASYAATVRVTRLSLTNYL